MIETHNSDEGERSDASQRWLFFAETELEGLPVYDRLCRGMAGDPEMLDLLCVSPRGQRRPNLILAIAHDLLLGRPDHPLSEWYPTVSGHPPRSGDPYPVFRDLVLDSRGQVADSLRNRTTQTNEPNRSRLWFAALTRGTDLLGAPQPIALIELGASAGLNLLVDRYGYESEPGAGVLPEIGFRIGVDIAPVDASDPRAASWLRACIWAEQPERLERLDAALATAARHIARHGPLVVAGDAVDSVADMVDRCPPDLDVVIVSSWMQTYLSRDRRQELVDTVDAVGRRRDLTWWSAEGPTVVPWMAEDPMPPRADTALPTLVGVRRWRVGQLDTAVLGRCHPHLRWLEWS